MSVFRVELLPARHGDAIWVEYGDPAKPHRMLIDGGATRAGRDTIVELMRERIPPGADVDFDLIVLSHIDADHLTGLLALFEDDAVALRPSDVWFNGWDHMPDDRLGAKQAERLTAAIRRRGLPWNAAFQGAAVSLGGGPGETPSLVPPIRLDGGLVLTLLSPTYDKLAELKPVWRDEVELAGLTPGARVVPPPQDDRLGDKPLPSDLGELARERVQGDASEANGASIAFLAEYGGHGILLTGDAHADVLASSIRLLLAQRGASRLRVDAVKVPHHGSKYNLTPELLGLLDCRRFLFSTDGTSRSRHPDPVAVARIVTAVPDAVLEFNYRTETTSRWTNARLQRRHGYTVRYPGQGEEWLTVGLIPG